MSLSSATTSAIWSDATHGASSPVEDDFAAGVATTGVASVRGKTLGKIETAGDADWFAVTLEAGVRYQFVADTLIAPFGAAALGNPRLRLLDADGKLVASDDNSFIGDRKSTRLNFSHVSESRMPSSA